MGSISGGKIRISFVWLPPNQRWRKGQNGGKAEKAREAEGAEEHFKS